MLSPRVGAAVPAGDKVAGPHEDPDQGMGSPEQPDAAAPGACCGAEPPPQEGSVAVVLRVRPPNPRERAAPAVLHVLNQHAVLFSSEEPGGTGGTTPPGRGPGRRRRNVEFEFDHVFDERATQEEVFRHTTLPLLDTLLAGCNCSVFAYGASGVGKTHTMMGSKTTPGIVHLATVELYKRLEAMKDKSCEVLISYQQVYKERVYDLLAPQGPLNVWEQPGKGAVAQGLSFHQPTSPEQLLNMLAKGNRNRAQRPTRANAASSRSHAIFQMQVKLWDPTGGPAGDPRVAKLSFVDLAGSERAWDTPGQGEGQWEGTSINRSLLAFKSVVRALAGGKGGQSYVPFRDSKLTLLLKDSLVGSFRSTVIAAVSPAASAGPDTYSTLRFASRARHILLPSLQDTAMSPCSSRTASPSDLQSQTRTPSPLRQDLQDQEQNLCPDEITAKTKEVEEPTGLEEHTGLEEPTGLEESIRLEEPTGLEEAALPCSPAESSKAAPAPGMQLSCAAEAPVTMPDAPVPSTDPQCCQELSPCSSPQPMCIWPVNRMLESSTDSQSENSHSSRTLRKCQQSSEMAAETPRAAQSPGQSSPVSPEPRCVSRQPSPPPGTPSLGTPPPEAARTPSPLPGPAPEQLPPSAEQQPELRAALPSPPPSTSPSAPAPNASSSSVPRSSRSPPGLFWPWFQQRSRVCAPSVGSVLYVCLQVMGGFRK